MCRRTSSVLAFAVAVLFSLCPQQAAAEPIDAFYRGKTINLVVASNVGGGLDIYARLVSMHMTRHIPGNPTISLKFMPGAGGILAANYLSAIAPRDGTEFALLQLTTPLIQVLTGGVQYNAKDFNYVGRVSSMTSVMMVWHTAPATMLNEAREKEIIFGADVGGTSDMTPRVMKNLLGFKFKVVTGYNGSGPVNLALERGEVHARVGSWSSWKSASDRWLREKKVIPLATVGQEKIAELVHVPRVMDLARSPEERKVFEFVESYTTVGRSFALPPGVPTERIAALRSAFNATLKDPAFLDEARRKSMDIEPLSGEEVQRSVEETVTASSELIMRTKKALELK